MREIQFSGESAEKDPHGLERLRALRSNPEVARVSEATGHDIALLIHLNEKQQREWNVRREAVRRQPETAEQRARKATDAMLDLARDTGKFTARARRLLDKALPGIDYGKCMEFEYPDLMKVAWEISQVLWPDGSTPGPDPLIRDWLQGSLSIELRELSSSAREMVRADPEGRSAAGRQAAAVDRAIARFMEDLAAIEPEPAEVARVALPHGTDGHAADSP